MFYKLILVDDMILSFPLIDGLLVFTEIFKKYTFFFLFILFFDWISHQFPLNIRASANFVSNDRLRYFQSDPLAQIF